MLYGLEVNETFWFCDTTERFAPSYGAVTDKRAFECCLEEYLQDTEGYCSLPRENNPWKFYIGTSKEEIEQGNGELIVTLHQGNKDALWELYQWANCLRIHVSY
jgi:hypothetical protein